MMFGMCLMAQKTSCFYISVGCYCNTVPRILPTVNQQGRLRSLPQTRFNPRSPRGERRASGGSSKCGFEHFNPRFPRGERYAKPYCHLVHAKAFLHGAEVFFLLPLNVNKCPLLAQNEKCWMPEIGRESSSLFSRWLMSKGSSIRASSSR